MVLWFFDLGYRRPLPAMPCAKRFFGFSSISTGARTGLQVIEYKYKY
jgi:hypothetical protein